MNDTVAANDRELQSFYDKFKVAATFQGRFAYLLMSFHAVNPSIFAKISDYDPHPILFANMLYGITVMIYSRPNMTPINTANRLFFSTMGSCMFNYSSMLFYDWLRSRLNDRPILLSILGFMSGRVMMVHLLAYLYHVDSRSNIPGVRVIRNSTYEAMYES